MDASYPYTVTLDGLYSSETNMECDLFRQGNLASGVSGYQYGITFDSNVGDLPALTVDGSGLWVSDGGSDNETRAEVGSFFCGGIVVGDVVRQAALSLNVSEYIVGTNTCHSPNGVILIVQKVVLLVSTSWM